MGRLGSGPQVVGRFPPSTTVAPPPCAKIIARLGPGTLMAEPVGRPGTAFRPTLTHEFERSPETGVERHRCATC